MLGTLSVEQREDIAVVTLRRPEKRNALSIDVRWELADTFERLANAEDVGAIVLTGAGSAFCAGMDTGEFGGDVDHRRALYESTMACFRGVSECPKPVVAAVNGAAVAGGLALALVCDLRIASTTARMGFPETAGGIPPTLSAARRVLAPAVAAELCLTGRVLDAQAALNVGLVSAVYPPEKVLPEALALAESITRLPRATVREIKRRVLIQARVDLGELLAAEEESLRRALLGPDREPAA